MKIGRTTEQERRKWNKTRKWHAWFAWYPVQLDDGRFVWLERVMRKNRSDLFTFYTWDYELILFKIDGFSKSTLKESCDSISTERL